MSRSQQFRSRLRPLTTFLRTEAGGAVVLLAATVTALVWANSPFADRYEQLWEYRFAVGAEPLRLTDDLRHWVNDGLMTVFFLVVGLEIKREIVAGELGAPRAAAAPVIAALGGMLAPALVYLAIAGGGPGAPGWGIPVATDIAFAVGAVALIGPRLPGGLKVFLLSVAVADDIGAILLIALAYSRGISAGWLGVAVGAVVAVGVLRKLRVGWLTAYLPLAVLAWAATLQSGIHATIAGVVLGLMAPAGEFAGRRPLEELELRLHPVSSYLVLPVFALANAGVELTVATLRAALSSPVAIGVVAGLLVGKTVGVTAGTWLALRSGAGRLPLAVQLRHVAALAPVAGIGFTVSLFIADLSFGETELLDAAKIGVLAGSVASGAVGITLLLWVSRRPQRSGARGGR